LRTLARATAQGVGRALAGLRRYPRPTLLALGAVALALYLAGSARLAAANVEAMTRSWGGGAQMVVYLEDDAGAALAGRIGAVLEDLPAVERVTYVPEEDALTRLAGSLGDDALIAGIEPGMLPASLEVTFAGGVADVAAAHPIVERLRASPGVEEVTFVGEWVERASALLSALRYAGLCLFVLVGGAALYIVAVAARLRLRGRVAEVEVYELAGATTRFVRWPMIGEGALVGAAGAALAAIAIELTHALTAGRVEHALQAAFGAGSVRSLLGAEILALVAAGALVGIAGSWMGSSRRAVA
jgi:cell division transport system permease protein